MMTIFQRVGCFLVLCFVLVAAVAQGPLVLAQDKSRVPPVATFKAMLQANEQSGWVKFRNYGNKQWIYFTALQTMHCRLREIRYSINSKALDRRFDLVKCNPQLPFTIPSKAGVNYTAIRLAKGTAKTLAVQVVWEDGAESVVKVYEPCKDVGEQTCAWPLE